MSVVSSRPSSSSSSSVLFAVALIAALTAASCTRSVYLVQQPDGSFVEADADEAVRQLVAQGQRGGAAAGDPVIVVRNADGTLAPLPSGSAPGAGQVVVLDAANGAVGHADGTVTVALDPTTAAALPDQVVIVDVAASNDFVLVDGAAPLYLQVTLAGADGLTGPRTPMSLAIVIDRSGSMAGEKLRDVKEAASWLVDNLAEDDHVALVSYASDVRLEGSGTLEAGGRARIKEAISGLHDGGGTNLSGGLVAGGDALREAMRESGGERGLSRVVLLSDGNANEGIVEHDALRRIADGYREHGVSVTTMGVGLDYNEELMEVVALAGGGNYYFIESSQALAGVFDRELDTLGRTVARDTVVVFTLPDGVRLSRVFGFVHEQVGNEVRVRINALAAGEQRRLLLELDMPGGKAGERQLVTEATVEFHDTIADRPVQLALAPVTVEYSGDPALLASNQDAEVVEKIERVLNAEVRREVFAELDKGNRSGAVAMVKARRQELAATNEVLESPALDAELQALEALEDTAEEVPEDAKAAQQHRNSGDFKRKKKEGRSEAIDLLVN